MFESRDEIRQVYLKVWEKMERQSPLEPLEAIIAEVIQLHPEYHPLLSAGESATDRDYSPEGGQTNPFLHMGMHITLREQSGSDRPAGIQLVYQKLVAQKGIHDAEHTMIECLGEILWAAQRNQAMPDENAYLACLRKL
jgi:hypothetical protein